jgi:hypothetical protein
MLKKPEIPEWEKEVKELVKSGYVAESQKVIQYKNQYWSQYLSILRIINRAHPKTRKKLGCKRLYCPYYEHTRRIDVQTFMPRRVAYAIKWVTLVRASDELGLSLKEIHNAKHEGTVALWHMNLLWSAIRDDVLKAVEDDAYYETLQLRFELAKESV